LYKCTNVKRNLIYCIPIIVILITPFTYSDNLHNGVITAKQIWFYGAMALLIAAFGIDLLFRKKNVSIGLNIIDIALLTFYIYFFIRSVYTPYTPLLDNTRLLNYTLLILFYFIVRYANSDSSGSIDFGSSVSGDKKNKGLAINCGEILVGILILTGLVQAVWGLLQLYGILPSFHSGFKITGTFFNPAPYALYLAAVFPIALSIINNEGINNERINNERINNGKMMREAPMTLRIMNLKIFKRSNLFSSVFQFLHSFISTFLINKIFYYISLLTVIAIILVLPATMNRASWLGVAAGSLVVFNYRYDLLKKAKAFLNNTARKLFASAIVVLLIGLSGAGLYFLKKGSSDGKLLIWEVATGKIAEKPLFGYGVGRFEAEYNNWQADYFKTHPNEMTGAKGMAAGNTKYCFNEYLEMAYELGLIGLFLFLAVIASIFLVIKGLRMKELIIKGDKQKTINPPSSYSFIPSFFNSLISSSSNSFIPSFFNSLIIILPSLISLLVIALISFPFYSLPTLIIFFLLLALLSSHIGPVPAIKRLMVSSLVRSITRFAALIVLLPISVLLLFMARQQFKTMRNWSDAVMMYQTGSYEEAGKSFSDIYVPLQYTGSYLQYYGKALSMDEEYPRSIEMMERAVHFTSDEVLYTTLGDNYKTLKRYSKAEEAYLYASYMVPHKLYPLYLLANLYCETGQNEKAIRTAEEVLNKNIKVESTATKEIRQAMSDLIEKMKKGEEGLIPYEQIQTKEMKKNY
jgi:O-antigen polymerase